jgi:DNA-binding PadR family transcriptional regulator
MFGEEVDSSYNRSDGNHRRNLIRHTATVPKGFIRFHVLGALAEKPMSGSELTEKIERHAGGFWKPSPGSIYPLLSSLQEHGYIKELPTENSLKRYELTETGKLLLNEQKDLMKKFKETMGFPQPPFRAFLVKMPPEKVVEIQSTMRRAGDAMFQLSALLQENFSGQALNEAIQAIDEASRKLEEIAKKLQGEKNESK